MICPACMATERKLCAFHLTSSSNLEDERDEELDQLRTKLAIISSGHDRYLRVLLGINKHRHLDPIDFRRYALEATRWGLENPEDLP